MMKRIPFIALLMVLTFTACNKNKFHVEGTITDAKDSTLYFEHMSLDGPVAMDSVKLGENGEFAFSGDAPTTPEFYRLRIANGIINVSVDSTETVKFKASYPTMSTKYEVEGSENCSKIKELALLQQQLLGRAIAISNSPALTAAQSTDSINAIVEQFKALVRNNYIFKEPQKAYSYFALFQALGNRLIFNAQESDMDARTFAAVATAWDTYYPEAERGMNLHNIAIEGLKALRIKEYRKHGPVVDINKVEEVNIIDIPLIDNHGKKRSLTEFKGSVVLLDFHLFAAKNSAARIMQLREIYNKYHAKGLEIYQVSVDPDEHFWKTQTAALPWVSVHDPDGVQSKNLMRYNVQSIPTFFLIDRTNTLYKRDAQIKDLDEEILKLL